MPCAPRARSRARLCLAPLLMVASAATCPAQPQYELTVLDSLAPGYNLAETYLWDINESGIGCGNTSVSDTDAAGNTSITTGGFYWTGGTGAKNRIDLSGPHGINNNGWIVGFGRALDIGTGQSTTLPPLPGYSGAPVLLGVNDGRTAVGYQVTCNCSNSQGRQQVPYVWDAAGGARTIPVPSATGASRINADGLVVGWIGGRASPDAFVHDLASGRSTLISSLFPPTPDGYTRRTTAQDVSDSGVVVGEREGDDFASTRGYLWSPALGGAPTILPLPAAPGYRPIVRPTSINRTGVVVGSIVASDQNERAFVYDAAQGLRDLNTLAAPSPGFVMRAAFRINDQGWIVGYGAGGGGFYRAFVLRPVQTLPPCPADFNGQGGASVQDIFDFLAAYFAGTSAADFNASGSVSVQDIFDFLTAYFTGCP